MSVMTPVVVPLMTTETPVKGSPVSVSTLPSMVLFCARAPKARANQKVSSQLAFIILVFISCYFQLLFFHFYCFGSIQVGVKDYFVAGPYRYVHGHIISSVGHGPFGFNFAVEAPEGFFPPAPRVFGGENKLYISLHIKGDVETIVVFSIAIKRNGGTRRPVLIGVFRKTFSNQTQMTHIGVGDVILVVGQLHKGFIGRISRHVALHRVRSE